MALHGYIGLTGNDLERMVRNIELFSERADRRIGARAVSAATTTLTPSRAAATDSASAFATSIARWTRPNRSTSYAA